MPISTVATVLEYNCDNATVRFPISFDYLDEDSLEGELAYRVKVSRTSVLLAQLIGKHIGILEGRTFHPAPCGLVTNNHVDIVGGEGKV